MTSSTLPAPPSHEHAILTLSRLNPPKPCDLVTLEHLPGSFLPPAESA